MTSSINTRALWGLAAAFLFGAAVSIGQTFEVVHNFTASEGNDAQSGVIQMSNGDFAGTTVGGMGTLYVFDTQGHFSIRYSFDLAEGTHPHATLVQDPKGLLFGATLDGALGWGSLYSWDLSSDLRIRAKLVPSSVGANGQGGSDHAPLLAVQHPWSSLVKYYGVMTHGGSNGFGTIFTLDADNDEYVTLRHFSGPDGKYPSEALVEVDGLLYGTTPFGGATDKGTIYVFDPEHPDFNFRVLHSFAGEDGAVPQAALLAIDGRLYGTTNLGGTYGKGTVFSIDLSGANYSVIHHFQGLDGANPHAALMQARDKHIYGTTTTGGAGDTFSFYGSIFRMDVGYSNDFSIIHRFSQTDGISTQARLIEASDGALYGSTQAGGSEDRGVVFRLVLVPVSIAPSSGPASGGTAIAISGGNFHPGAELTFAGKNAENLVATSDSSMTATTPALAPGTLNDVLVDNPDNTRGGILKGYLADFLDVPQGDIFHGYVEKIFRNRITAGVGNGNYGRNQLTTRAQMAVFLLKAEHGPFYVPPVATAKPFEDVELGSFAADWIAQLKAEQITSGCDGGTNYCPNAPTTREAMAAMLLKAMHGWNFVPPPCTGIFGDVSCASGFAPWIEELYKEGITGGCYNEGGIFFFCPGLPSTRGQTSVFLTKAFQLE